MPALRPTPGTPTGLLIRYHRQRRGLRQSDFAARPGTCAATVSQWERGHRFVPLARRTDIADELGIPPERLAEPDAVAVDPDERLFLDALRHLPPPEREALLDLVLSYRPEITPC